MVLLKDFSMPKMARSKGRQQAEQLGLRWLDWAYTGARLMCPRAWAGWTRSQAKFGLEVVRLYSTRAWVELYGFSSFERYPREGMCFFFLLIAQMQPYSGTTSTASLCLDKYGFPNDLRIINSSTSIIIAQVLGQIQLDSFNLPDSNDLRSQVFNYGYSRKSIIDPTNPHLTRPMSASTLMEDTLLISNLWLR